MVLARLGPEHFDAIAAWDETPEALFTWAGPAFTFPLDAGQLQRYADESPSCNRSLFAYVDPDTGDLVGQIGLSDVDSDQRSAYIVRAVIDPRRRGEGLGRAMFSATLSHAFGELGLHRVEQRILASNGPALGCAEGLGFWRDGVLRDARHMNGSVEDLVILSMLEPEWRP